MDALVVSTARAREDAPRSSTARAREDARESLMPRWRRAREIVVFRASSRRGVGDAATLEARVELDVDATPHRNIGATRIVRARVRRDDEECALELRR